MRVFVTGASGHIASAVIPELLNAGHEVVGLARSENSAAAVKALGAEVRRGDLADPDGLRAAAAEADAVVHLAFDHAAMAAGDMAGAAATDRAVVQAFGEALAGTGKAFLGVGMGHGDGNEHLGAAYSANPRIATVRLFGEFTGQGVRTVLVGIPPVVHSARDRDGFLPILIRIARAKGVSGYPGDGSNRWSAVHTLDLARLYRLALEKAPAGAELHAAADEGVAVRDIADVIGRRLGIPVQSVPEDRRDEHFGFFGAFVSRDMLVRSGRTRELLGWQPVEPGLVADLEQGHYFAGE
ncbi:SDR family oxidoreductase [Streptomyces fuscichromogenes]|uniref:Oxidoreductase n=1 Tax=Streptomyces fuscichromogenes TaxID=1324013 RepID=A0A917XB57_9ACTN|nr:SDR family oxidoreductase [Streptomyces fuscichromogenes]GGN04343.1 oxidoreductase [Streptomyces fuscichromogenes]